MLKQEKDMLESLLKASQREAQDFAHRLGAQFEVSRLQSPYPVDSNFTCPLYFNKCMRSDKELLAAHKMAQVSAEKEVRVIVCSTF